jgi:hypothetical protein
MKTLLYILAFAGFISASYAQVLQPADVPTPVQKAFTRSNPKIDSVAWIQTGDSFLATFRDNQLEKSYMYNASGKLVQKEEQVSIGQLPTQALKYINDNIQDGYVRIAKKITKAGGKSYFLVNIKDMELNFDSGGKFLTSSRG